MKSGKRKRDEESADDRSSGSSSSEEERGEVKRSRPSWSKEDDLLLKRLKEKGGKWENISKSFPGRTVEACKNRYSKFVFAGEKKFIHYNIALYNFTTVMGADGREISRQSQNLLPTHV
jgi:hypothetical protein